ncbi:MAG: TetR/AcrR family transcriptional regulator [Crocinitomicaceae bacterium]|nr:TetR/AcrR family transcriptional regulator [Crocinitomicaceae bacterium]
MDEKKRELITQATAIYLKYGIKSVTMDEMARQLGISKKTLYSYVADKNELVELCVLLEHEGEVCRMGEISKTNENAIDEMLAISTSVAQELKKIHPSIFFDLAKYHPNALKMMNAHKREFVKGCVTDNLQRGIKQGLYRSDINIEVVATIYLATIDHIMLGDIFPDSHDKLDLIYQEFFSYHLRGIANNNGLEYLNELTKQNENN